MAYTKKTVRKKAIAKKAVAKKVAPKKSKKAVKKVTAKRKPLMTPISPKKPKGIKLPPLSEKDQFEYHKNRMQIDSNYRELQSVTGRDNLLKDRHKVISVTVRNVTNRTLADVSIFNNDFFKQQDVHYSTNNEAMTYESLLRRKNAMNNDKNTVANLHITSENRNAPFRLIWFVVTDIDGAQTKIPFTPLLNPNQNQGGITMLSDKFPMNNCLDVVISSLDPDTRVTYTFTVTDSPAT